VKNKKAPIWSKFSWDQYKADTSLRLCSFAAQGLWMRMLCEMHEATPYGHLVINGKPMTVDDLAVLTGRPAAEIAPLLEELESRGVFSRRCELDADPDFADTFDHIRRLKVTLDSDASAIVCRSMIRNLLVYLRGQEGGRASTSLRFAGKIRGDLEVPLEARSTESPYASHKGGKPPSGNGNAPEMTATGDEEPAPVQTVSPGSKLFLAKKPLGKPARPEHPNAQALFSEGLRILNEVHQTIGKNVTEPQLRTVLGKLRKEAREDDARLLDLLRESRDKAEPIAWVMGALAAKEAPRVIVNNDPNDRWGIQAWCERRQFAPTTDESDRKLGKWIAKLGKCNPIIDNVAKRLAEGARFPSSFVPDWDVLADWIASGIPHANIVTTIARAASQEGYDSKSIRSLRYFNGWVGYRQAA
jgi:hypothetical protein